MTVQDDVYCGSSMFFVKRMNDGDLISITHTFLPTIDIA